MNEISAPACVFVPLTGGLETGVLRRKLPTASGDTLFQLVFMMQTAQDVLNCDPTIARQSMSRVQLREMLRLRRLRDSWTKCGSGSRNSGWSWPRRKLGAYSLGDSQECDPGRSDFAG
jgi:hypothetical protein